MQGNDRAAPVEEKDVEREAHAKRVDARTAWDQQARTRLSPVEQGEAEQPRPEARRFANLDTEDGRNRKTRKARGQ